MGDRSYSAGSARSAPEIKDGEPRVFGRCRQALEGSYSPALVVSGPVTVYLWMDFFSGRKTETETAIRHFTGPWGV